MEDHRRDKIKTNDERETKTQTKDNHMIRVGQEKYPRRYNKQRNTTQTGRQKQIEHGVEYRVPGYKESCTSAFTK